jgi:predicted nucleic acid-binding protein
MREFPSYVIDASVVVKWYLHDEAFVQQALSVRNDFASGLIDLVAPGHLRFEVPSAILNATRQPSHPGSRATRLNESAGQQFIDDFLTITFPLFSTADLIRAGYAAAREAGCSFYDGVYVALARSLNLPLIHAEPRFRTIGTDLLPQQVWIENY